MLEGKNKFIELEIKEILKKLETGNLSSAFNSVENLKNNNYLVEDFNFIYDIDARLVYKLFLLWSLKKNDKNIYSLSSNLIESLDPTFHVEILRELYSFVYSRLTYDSVIRNKEFILFLRNFVEIIKNKIKKFDFDVWSRGIEQRWISPVERILPNPRCVLFTFGFLVARDSSTHVQFVKNRIKALVSAGFDVKICFNGEHSVVGPGLNNYPYTKPFQLNHNNFWRDVVKTTPIYVNPEDGKSITEVFLEKVNEAAPDVIAFLGDPSPRGSDVFRSILYKKYPIVYFPCQIARSPGSEFDGAVSAIPAYKDYVKKIKSPQKVFRYVTFPFEIIGEEDPFNLARLMWNDALTIIVTPLGNNRLVSVFESFSEIFLNEIESLFKKHANLVWLLVGLDEDAFNRILTVSDVFKKLYRANRLRGISRIGNLRGLYRVSNIYFSPPGMLGGGGGAGMAVYEKLPVVASVYSDSSARALEELTYRTDEEVSNILTRLILDKNYRMLCAAKARHEMDTTTIEYSSKLMKEAIELIYMKGMDRLLRACQ